VRNWKFNPVEFDKYPVYEGNDLGVFWSEDKTMVKVWAPSATRIFFRLYREGFGGDAEVEHYLEQRGNGIWLLELSGDWNGWYYTLQVRDNYGWLLEGPDIYARSTGINGRRGMIFNPAETNPEGWSADERVVPASPTDMVIYETHIRDFSMSPDSGIRHKGKYLGFTETGTKSPTGEKTGLNHLDELGVTHVHLLPVADFYTVDERKEAPQYNWGYDPLNYNTPEGWYSTDPNDGRVRVRELKQLVKALHEQEIGVILDVVYNHTGLINESYFNQTVPGYFYRQKEDGGFSDASGCGNELASERAMVRKYIVDSVMYWASEYHIDGFRFDLMGVLDIETMNIIRKSLDTINPNIFLYGEGWTAGKSPLEKKRRATKRHTLKLDRIASFSDDMRDGLKGSAFDQFSTGFISGHTLQEERLKFSMVGAVKHDQIAYDYVESSKGPWANEAAQCINYVSCHDNFTLFDKLQYSCPEASKAQIERMVRLALGIVLTSQGVPFLHAGSEMMRTKGGHHDSYRSPDLLNQIDWSRKHEFHNLFLFTQKCIELRRQHPAFRMSSAKMINEKMRFNGKYIPGIIQYELGDYANGDSWKSIQMLFNGNNYSVELEIPEANWLVIAEDGEINPNGMGRMTTGKVRIHPTSMMILVAED